MKQRTFFIGSIPAVLYGEDAPAVWLFIHGQGGYKEEGEGFARLACPKGQQVLAVDLPGHGQRSASEPLVPWTVVPEIAQVAGWAWERWENRSLRATSIGAYFSLLAIPAPQKALFVSPVVDMERLIRDMMGWAGVTEEQLQRLGEIPTEFGQTLSWRYLCYAREHPVPRWECPIHILYAGQDELTSRRTVERFAAERDAQITIFEEGEHWFHTPEQLEWLRRWEEACL